jgi:hypothetical protein
MDFLKLVTTNTVAMSLIHTRYSSLQNTVSLLSLLCLHQLSPGNGFNHVDSLAGVFHRRTQTLHDLIISSQDSLDWLACLVGPHDITLGWPQQKTFYVAAAMLHHGVVVVANTTESTTSQNCFITAIAEMHLLCHCPVVRLGFRQLCHNIQWLPRTKAAFGESILCG